MGRVNNNFYIVDKIEQTFKTLKEIKYYIEENLNPFLFECCWIEKYNLKTNERTNVYYVSVSKNGKVSFK